ncbi:unnamed protein product [Amoebophrya sp. A120]|nr:unnamed protein product [Amoebophrya sp. A120]|eukprot:GSA120T00010848001.1
MPETGLDAGAMPTGLGNFKGVMLCNRPDLSAPKTKDPTEMPPFYSAVAPGALEPLGMLHPNELNPMEQKRDMPPAMKKHRKWLQNLQDELKTSKTELQAKADSKESKVVDLREKCADQRQAVRDALSKATEEVPQQTKNHPEFLNNLKDAVAVSEDKPLPEPLPASKMNAAANKDGGKKKKKNKPLWAMSATEKEENEEHEVADLLDFAQNLNFEDYVEDLEFRQALSVLKGRANDLLARTEQKFLKDVAEKKKELITEVTEENLSELEDKSHKQKLQATVVSGVSQSVSQRGGRKAVEEEEESSYYSTEPESAETATSVSSFSSYGYVTLRRKREEAEKAALSNKEEDLQSVASSSREVAKEVLKENPEMKAVHSKESVMRMVEKLAAGIEELSKRPANREPLIVTSDDHHPVQREALDPKNVAYLYRSPAI